MADIASVHAELETLAIRPRRLSRSVALSNVLLRGGVVFQARGSSVAFVVFQSEMVLAIEQRLRHDEDFQDESGAGQDRADPEQPAVAQRRGDVAAGNAGDERAGGKTHGVRNHGPATLVVEEDVACDFRSESVDRTTGESLQRSRREER